ncbi:copper-translocating P-type ATPase [Avibacterium paragallinarum]|uniref:Copper-exporting P-type ATPase n=1 Tax=Avibacterium paragallinarum TaxID=728 RepID=A0AAE5TGX1_AVIPA|nr:copper-translocating P-type ATPase [Avibacterium paragallinarum]MEE3608955.1 copper-translocating P-type ATPase [Avibacterium paragallinarum]MEE3620673.1 copper-translocating P-type ATPase [Avibacterium paragallinarum]MEE3668278.1 copper-translocating P-type ATPase [Avibacterium paragallinarum]MEE3680849.1 copper-translocating P-type ATPase [Avibacterium paragallinarum]MEE4384935.1 copper-translocating P-type ATPase [Avibacterium paragallinarum]
MLSLEGLSCAACVAKVQKALQAVPQVSQVQVNLAEQTALVSGNATPQSLVNAVQQAGYGAEVVEDQALRAEKQQRKTTQEIHQRKWQGFVALGFGAALMLWGLLGGSMQVNASNRPYWLIVGVATLLVMILTGKHFYQKAGQNLLHRTATMDTLVALGTSTAWLYSMFVCLKPEFFPENARHLYFEAAAMIIGFINLGKMFEAKAKQHSSQALAKLLDLTPKIVHLITPQGTQDIPLSEVKAGMILRLQTGERVAVDGTIREGQGWFDESMLTGEPIPVQKQRGDKLSAGTLVADGSVLYQAEQIGEQTTLANIIKLVRQAQSSKPKIGILADKIAGVFVPVVITIALVAALIWFIYGPTPQFSYALVIFTTILIIACPCALGLATPMSIISGIGRAAELGILVRDADALQKAATADTIVFDKTGTLTKGSPKVTALYCFNDYNEQQVSEFAASLEQGASHPLAKGIVQFNQEKGFSIKALDEFNTLQGLGVSGVVEGKNAILGNRTLMAQQGVDIQPAMGIFQQETAVGATVVFLAIDQQLAGMFIITDPLREDSEQALQRLHQQGYELIMLTGDQEKTAQFLAKDTAIDRVIAGVLPEQKANVIKALQQQGRKVVMVGDGINDAPALAQADVSIAMGSGSDIAIETAELTLMRHSISAVADALCLSKGILRNMKQNLFGAFIYNILGIPIAAGLLYPLFGILLNPMIGGLAMALSSITVVSNANRLLKFKVQ